MKRLWYGENSVSDTGSHRHNRVALLSFSCLDIPEHLESFLRLRIARSVLYLHLLYSSAAFSQRTSLSFGPMTDLSLGYTPTGLVSTSRPPEIAVLAQETPTVFFYALRGRGGIVETDAVSLSTVAREIVVEHVDPKGPAEYCVLSAHGLSFAILKRIDTLFTQRSYALQTASQHAAYGDVNNDRRKDILLFGKKRVGITAYLRQKDGSLAQGPLLFPDLSISDVHSTDLNGDGITDLFVLDWLSNQLALFYGIGQAVYSEQVEVALPGEPADIAISPVTKERTLRIAVSVPEEKLVAMFTCNATGEIEQAGTLRLQAPPTRVQYANINSDPYLDLLVATEPVVYVYLGKSSTQLGAPTPFGAGAGIVAYNLNDLDEDSKTDLVLIDRSSRRLIAFANAEWSGTFEWPSTYGVGSIPTGIGPISIVVKENV